MSTYPRQTAVTNIYISSHRTIYHKPTHTLVGSDGDRGGDRGGDREKTTREKNR